MKSKTIYNLICAIVLIAAVVLWKINSYYKQEQFATIENQIHQQNLTLTTSVSAQLTQLKNIISSYQGLVEENKINWVQLNPFYGLAQLEISSTGAYNLKNIFVKSGTLADSWTINYLQKALSYSRHSNKEIHAQLFQSQSGDKFVALIFSSEKVQGSQQAVALFGEASYFQKYFDTQRSLKTTNLLMTTDEIVVAHTQSDYIATKSQEQKIKSSKYLIDKDDIRSANLFTMSYALKKMNTSFLFIPTFILTFILGFVLVLIGLALYILKPIENENRKAEIFKKVFEEVQAKPAPTKQPESQIIPEPAHKVVFELENKNIKNNLKDEIIFSSADVKQIPDPLPEPIVLIGVKPVQLSFVVKSVLEALSVKITTENLKIDTHFESTKIYEIDVDRFKKAIENLILNSIEAHAKRMTIKIYDVRRNLLGQLQSSTQIDITDDGKGIASDVIDKVWQPFFGTKDKLKHKGLGLSESLSVVRRYGADIAVVANPGFYVTGTTVRISMDLLNQDQDVDASDLVILSDDDHDIDIDSLLRLDEVDDEAGSVNLIEQEFTTTQFKIDSEIQIPADPKIEFTPSVKPIDSFNVKVRKPGRT